MNLEYQTWQEALAAAILEFDHQELSGKLQRAEEAIARRIQELRFEEKSGRELRLLFEGLSIIRDVRQDRLALGVARASSRSRF